MISPARVWAMALVVAYVVAVSLVGLAALRYERVLAGMGSLPPLAAWTFRAHSYTPLFFLFSIPAILCAISNQLTATLRRVAMSISVIGLILLALWFMLIWLGMGRLVELLS